MLTGILLFFQLFCAAGVIVTVILHAAKGEGLGGIGGQAKVFGSQKGLEEGLNRLTAFFAVGFVVLSLILAIIVTK